MLRRLIGEEIDLAWMPGVGVWQIKIDPSQVDQILANLIVNARDAIAGTGKITIESQNITLDTNYCNDHAGFIPGAYVMLAVSDDGCGMDDETIAHIFEPFFTTKEPGQGTGLGLATVYGIVKQNNGFINVYSELGVGTTFKMFLPRFTENVEEIKTEVVEEISGGHGETILIVEDEPLVVKLSSNILEKLNYIVLTAETPRQAIQIALTCNEKIHLLITDVIMPEMNGKELAARLNEIIPGLKCLYISGYTSNVITHHSILEDGVNFLAKPFSMQELASKVNKVLGQK
jgi:CheY-like chemotaxis protein